MDLYILFTAFARFILFLIIQFIIFRRINKQEVVKWIIYVFLLSGFISFLVELSLVYEHINSTLIAAELISLFMYFFITVFYILGIFGLMISSLRIRLLSEIANSDQGIREDQLLELYNKKIIVERRLKRLTSTKEIIYRGGLYYTNNRFSIFFVHEKLHDILRRVFL